MILLDLYCGAGGASVGYARAGFTAIGVDIAKQPRYPYTFHRGHALDLLPWLIERYRPAVIAASPPCKVHTALRPFSDPKHVDMIPATRDALRATDLPYVIENVPGAPLEDPITLCGSMFRTPPLWVLRHRLFESNWVFRGLPACDHRGQAERSPGFKVARYHSGSPIWQTRPTVGVYGGGNGGGPGELDIWREAMGIPWMSRREIGQAIPPAYTHLLGSQLMKGLSR